ncbi:hypothetical protein [uncultured Rikenella sp.]|nr:hypothetical protein [uncultured Rikenella sp.]
MYLGFDVTWLRPSYSDTRAYGFQLRCLSEETKIRKRRKRNTIL